MLLQFKIQIKDITKPPVWGRVLVPANFTFDQFHKVIQEAFGWGNYHLYQFSPQGYGSYPTFAIPSEDYDDDIIDSLKTKLKKIFTNPGQTFTYIYDFGDDWRHKITLEEVRAEKGTQAELLAGKGACPPEDCGGPWGYQHQLQVLADPKHEEYNVVREWLSLDEGDTWDVHEFDLAAAKENVASLS